MKILYAALRHDYGDPNRGPSPEHNMFYDTLVKMGHDILYLDLGAPIEHLGEGGLDRRLLEVVEEEAPDLLFTSLFADELSRETIEEVTDTTDTTTVNWFSDDTWRFDTFSRHWAPAFDWVVTTDQGALRSYQEEGIDNVIKSQWACNHFLYHDRGLRPEHDLTFVGQAHGYRPAIIEHLKREGLPIQAWGSGWDNGRVSLEGMIQIFNSSRINLNLSYTSRGRASDATLSPDRLRDRVSGFLDRTSIGRALKTAVKRGIRGVRSVIPSESVDLASLPLQVKARNFEIPGCGGFLLTNAHDEFEAYLTPGKEIAVYEDLEDLVAKTTYYLENDTERESIAQAGHERTLNEHTYVHRFEEIFRKAGLPADIPETVWEGKSSEGTTRVVT